MDRKARFILGVLVAGALAAPQTAFAQRNSNGGTTQGSAAPRNDGGTVSSPSSPGGGSAPSTAGSPPQSSAPDNYYQPQQAGGRSGSSGSSGGSSGGSSTGTAAPRSGSGSSSSGSAGTRSGGSTSGGSTAARPPSSNGGQSGATSGGTVNTPLGRSRSGGRSTGTAATRPQISPSVTGLDFPLFGPWGRWAPLYGSGFGWNFGYVAFNPWAYYGGTRWVWGRYGYYDPFDPFAYPYDPYWYPDSYDRPTPAYGGGSNSTSTRKADMGSLRLKASPASAKVYIDGTLMGTVDDFDGLTHHLEVAVGDHQLELRADGYQTVTKDVTVDKGVTTVRLSMKKT